MGRKDMHEVPMYSPLFERVRWAVLNEFHPHLTDQWLAVAKPTDRILHTRGEWATTVQRDHNYYASHSCNILDRATLQHMQYYSDLATPPDISTAPGPWCPKQ